MKKLVIFTVIFLIVAICSSLQASDQEILIATNVDDGNGPCGIHNNKVVWKDLRSSSWGEIRGINLLTNQEFLVRSPNHKGPVNGMIDIYEDKIVWMDSRTWIGDIYLYNLNTGAETKIAGPADQWTPRIHKDIIVWMDSRNGNFDIYGYDLSSYREFRITSKSSEQWTPDIYNNIVVYHERGESNVYGYNLSTSTDFQVTSSGRASGPRIYGDKVIYFDSRSGITQLYCYDLSTNTEFQITNNAYAKTGGAIYENIVVWSDNRNGNYDIFGYNLSTNKEFQITNNLFDQKIPEIDGDIVGWYDYRSGQVSLYVRKLSTLNSPPSACAGQDQIVEQTDPAGANVTLDGTCSSDPDGDTLTYTWTFPWTDESVTGPTPTVLVPHGTWTVTLEVSDGTDIDTDTAEITVQDTTAPVVSNTTANPNPVAVNTECTITAQINDLASNITYAEYSTDGGIQWYNMDPITAGTNSVNVSVTMPGVLESAILTISVRGTDKKDNTSALENIYLPVYDPSAGFVTGGGWIWSPKGAYTADATLEGKAHFGFVAKYKKGANIPDGDTEFQFSTADFYFYSDTYDWLVVAGYKAMFKGIGTIEGDPDSHKFMISCVDGDLKGNDAKDTFRIRIWDEDGNGGETTIYDNQMGADMDSEATTELGGGSIIIHSGK